MDVYFIYGGGADLGVDCTVDATSPVHFDADQATATVTVTVMDDDDYEGSETLILTITPDAAYFIGADSAEVVIIDDDLLYVPDLIITTGNPYWTGPAPDVLEPGMVGVEYSLALEAATGTPPHAWALVEPGMGPLPDGLALGPSGIISGTPTAAGTYYFTLEVTDSAPFVPLSGQKDFVLVIDPPSTVFLTGSLPPATIGQGYDTQIEIGGLDPATTTFSVTTGELPAGLYMNALFVPVSVHADVFGQEIVDELWGYTYVAGPDPNIASVNPPEGTWNGGTVVTITGTNFPTAAVKQDAIDNTRAEFGGSVATITDIDNVGGTWIVVTTPSHSPAELVSVGVEDLGTGGADEVPDAFTYFTGAGDLNGDGTVDGGDLAIIIANVGLDSVHPSWDPRCDPDSNGVCNLDDLMAVFRNWGSVY